MSREGTVVYQSFVILRGMVSKGIDLYGPFISVEEAKDYGDKNFPNDTREIMTMLKEEVTHGEETSNNTGR
jgi:hypothetical protein